MSSGDDAGRVLLVAVSVALTASMAALPARSSRAAGPGPWVVTSLGIPGEASSEAVDINNRGQVVVHSKRRLEWFGQAYLWQDGQVRELGSLGRGWSIPSAINERGQVVGSSRTASGRTHAFLWDQRGMIDIGKAIPRSHSDAVDISERGEIIIRTPLRGYVWRKGKITDLGTLGAKLTEPLDINDRGQVVGWSKRGSHGEQQAFLWQNGKMTELGSPGRTRSIALAINNRGQIVGNSFDEAGTRHAVLWEKGKIVDLGAGAAIGINERGQVVGWADGSGAFVWTNGEMTDLGNVLPISINNRGQVIAEVDNGRWALWENGTWLSFRGPPKRRTQPTAFNERNQIVGQVQGSDPLGLSTHAVLWTRRRP